MIRHKYDKPSIVEAVCLIRFDPAEAWDSTLIGRFYNEIESDFPEKQETRQVGHKLSSGEGTLSIQLEDVSQGMLFKSSDGTKIAQIMKNAVGANWLKPYGGWEEYKRLIERVFKAYLKVAKPKQIRTFGLRYIDLWEFSTEGFDFQYYFEASKFLPQVVESSESFQLQVGFDRGEEPRRVIKMKSDATNSAKRQVWLDIDCINNQSMECDANRLLDELEKAHDWIVETFESCIKDKLRHDIMGLESK